MYVNLNSANTITLQVYRSVTTLETTIKTTLDKSINIYLHHKPRYIFSWSLRSERSLWSEASIGHSDYKSMIIRRAHDPPTWPSGSHSLTPYSRTNITMHQIWDIRLDRIFCWLFSSQLTGIIVVVVALVYKQVDILFIYAHCLVSRSFSNLMGSVG